MLFLPSSPANYLTTPQVHLPTPLRGPDPQVESQCHERPQNRAASALTNARACAADTLSLMQEPFVRNTFIL